MAERKAVIAAFLLWAAVLGVTFCIIYKEQIVRTMTDPEYVRNAIRSVQPYGALVYIVLQAIQILIVFIPGEPLELAAGYAFGSIPGTL
ncbi:MAG: hypothetical protein IKG76_10090, partial [Firmicutes bacterium]|nr:hypothetical protein [Bacillota bacterium]